jgi:two-component system KDP operon response regulator KdpE
MHQNKKQLGSPLGKRVLVIDQLRLGRKVLLNCLEQDNHEVVFAADDSEALQMAASHAPDIVLVDVYSANKNRLDVCKKLRSWSNVPIIVLSSIKDEKEKIRALDLGADYYVTKPFGQGELLARMRAIARRMENKLPEKSIFTCQSLKIDFVTRKVMLHAEEIALTAIEYDLLRYMTRHANKVVTHEELRKLWLPKYLPKSHTVRVHVANLRKKIENPPSTVKFIQTETRVGYRFLTKEKLP